MVRRPPSLDAPVMDPLDELDRIAVVLDGTGRIERVNAAWSREGERRGLRGDWVGTDYLALAQAAADTGAPRAGEVLDGLRALRRGADHRLELGYPCDEPDGRLVWKSLIAQSLPDGRVLLVHLDAPDPRVLSRSERRLADLAYRRLLDIDTRCAWCGRMADPDGAWRYRPTVQGSQVTDGMCPDCDARLTATLATVRPHAPRQEDGAQPSARGAEVAV